MAVKILATGDIHLGKRSADIPENTSGIATQHTWGRIVDYAIDNNLDAMLLSGDIVDEENKYFEAGKALATGCQKLEKHNIPVCMVAGNHDFDVLPEIIKTHNFSNVHLLGANGTWELKTLNTQNGDIQIAGWSFPATYVPYNPLTKFSLENNNPDIPAIGLLHADFSALTSQYAPVQEKDFLNKNMDAWVLGHIHKPALLSDSACKILYPGSPHAMSAKETGKHGPVLLTIHDKNNIQHQWLDFSPVRYESCSINTGTPASLIEIRSQIVTSLKQKAGDIQNETPQVRYLVYDVEITGKFNNINQIQQLREEIISETIIENHNLTLSVRKIDNKLKPMVDKLEELAKQTSPAGIIADTILNLEQGNITTFAENLINTWHKKHKEVISSKTFHPLVNENTGNVDEDAKAYILESCNHILDALLSQTKNPQS